MVCRLGQQVENVDWIVNPDLALPRAKVGAPRMKTPLKFRVCGNHCRDDFDLVMR